MADSTGPQDSTGAEKETQVAALTAQNAALAEQNKTLETETKWMSDRLKAEWDWPKKVTYALSFLAGGFAIFTFANQYMVVSEIRSRSKEVGAELATVRRVLDQAQDKVASAQEAVDGVDQKLEVKVKEFSESFEERLNRSIANQESSSRKHYAHVMRQVESSQRILALVSMGREQVFLKQNPSRALVFVDAAGKIYEKAIADFARADGAKGEKEDLRLLSGAILREVYPAVWNLQMECLLQTHQFAELRDLSNRVIGPATHSCVNDQRYCSLRPAFYYRALAGIHEMANFYDGLHPEKATSTPKTSEFNALVERLEADLDSSVGTAADLSIGTIYRAYMFALDGDYESAKALLRQTNLLQKASNYRPTLGQEANQTLARSLLDLAEFIDGTDLNLEPASCELKPEALSPWDAYLLEQLTHEVARRRGWHITATEKATRVSGQSAMSSGELTNTLGKFCVNWILSMRFACGKRSSIGVEGGDAPSPCGCDGGCSPDDTTGNRAARAELMADFRLSERAGGVTYSRDATLGRRYRRFLWMKVHGSRNVVVYVKQERTKIVTERVESEGGTDLVEKTKTYTVEEPVIETRLNPIIKLDVDTGRIPAEAYVKVEDSDISDIDRMIRDGTTAILDESLPEAALTPVSAQMDQESAPAPEAPEAPEPPADPNA